MLAGGAFPFTRACAGVVMSRVDATIELTMARRAESSCSGATADRADVEGTCAAKRRLDWLVGNTQAVTKEADRSSSAIRVIIVASQYIEVVLFVYVPCTLVVYSTSSG